MPIIIEKCSCKSEFQDKRYGKGHRVFNEKKKKEFTQEAVCTVCGQTKVVKVS